MNPIQKKLSETESVLSEINEGQTTIQREKYLTPTRSNTPLKKRLPSKSPVRFSRISLNKKMIKK